MRKLSRDLPAFDSVWIDALVGRGKLTPFQASLLEEYRFEDLTVGPWVLVDRLGSSERAVTYSAKDRSASRRVTLKRSRCPKADSERLAAELQDLIQRFPRVRHGGAVGPVAVLNFGEELITVSPFADGPQLRELLTRRGRFPADVVEAIARQMVQTLAELETSGILHGDLQLENVRISADGQAVLVDPGLTPILRPQLTVPECTTPNRYDGTAPERIGTGEPCRTTSDMYAMGCLLWHLLAGRSPYPTGDPLAKLVAHTSKRVPDVREIAIETPEPLAKIIHALTDPDPNRRPSSFRQLRDRWGTARPRHRNIIRSFRESFQAALGRPEKTDTSSGRWKTVAAMLLCVSGAAVTMSDAGLKSWLVNIPSAVRPTVPADKPVEPTDDASKTTPSPKPAPQALPLPSPDANGVIELEGGQLYSVSPINTVGPLTVRGVGTEPARLRITSTAWKITATTVTFESLDVGTETSVAMELQAENFGLNRCRFRSTVAEGTTSFINWQPLDSAGQHQVLVRDCHFSSGSVFTAAELPEHVRLQNSLFVDAASLLRVAKPESPVQSRIRLESVTVRDGQSLLDWSADRAMPSTLLQLSLTDCLLGLNEGGAIVRWQSPQPNELVKTLRIAGPGSLLGDGGTIAVGRASADAAWQIANDRFLSVEDFAIGRFQFTGSAAGSAANSQVTDWQGPRRSANRPGADVSRLTFPKFPTLDPIP
ncbi:serine/threonine protein kinase [Thalassoroseus pseudoceratinae]|uniref:serine/threonine protein kinase n=1 Tax=Thalassoroseus pseudoceratinae TaxID=2713176 RepID=UPI001420DD90|nr:serine/threonine-protein kinase [Thalassoroseus pseudoceratinae]